MATLAEFRQQHPQYNDIPDQQLADKLHDKYYSAMPKDQFYKQIGFAQPPPKPATPQPKPDAYTQAAQGVQSFYEAPGKEAMRQYNQAQTQLQADLKRNPGTIKGTRLPNTLDYAGRIAMDVMDIPYSFVRGAATAFPGKPVEKLTGGKIPAEATGTAVSIFAPMDIAAGGKISRSGMEAARDSAKALEKLFSPTTVSAESRAMEMISRRRQGQASLEAEKQAHSLIQHNKLVGNLPIQQQRQFIDAFENGRRQPTPQLQAAADALRKVYDYYKTRIQYVMGNNSPTFIKDYYSHLWKEKPQQVQDSLHAFYAKQGTGRSLKKRSIPTIADGIAAGLTPRIENPIEMTTTYARNMSQFLATHDTLEEMKAGGYAKWYTPGSQPKGWVPLQGIKTQKAAPRGPDKQAVINLYAPESVARVYNNFISKGLEGGDAGIFFKGARAAANGLTALKLGLSTFHLSTMANEAIVSEIARGIKSASEGRPISAAKSLARAPAAPVSTYMRGKQMTRELLNIRAPNSISSRINQLYVNSGGRIRMDPLLKIRGGSGSFFDAMKKGTFKRELGDAFSRIYKGTPFEKAKGTVDLAGNILQTAAAPIFEEVIPHIKQGTFARRMQDFIERNPGATQEEQERYAIKLNDSIDNRFGEMVQDNLFWHRAMKQAAQILLTSASWDIGTVREIAGGLKDVVGGESLRGLLSGKGVTDRTAYVAALAAATALENAAATYIKTGVIPAIQSGDMSKLKQGIPHGRDYLAYRTGGTDKTGEPERAMLPGYQKDVYAFGYDFPNHILTEGWNKVSPAGQMAKDYGTNTDYRGLPITKPEFAPHMEGEPSLTGDFLERLMPISFGSQMDKQPGSNLGWFERRVLSARPAPSYITAPEEKEQKQTKYDTQAWKRRIKADQKAQQQ